MEIKYWSKLSEAEQNEVLLRPAQASSAKVQTIVTEIIQNIQEHGDEALLQYSRDLDHFTGDHLEFRADEISAAVDRLDPKLKAAIDLAYENICKFHKAQKPHEVELETFAGIVCRTCTHPIEKVGLYVPGGSAPLVSTALMLAIPAQIAGCHEIVLCSPPPVSDAIVYAAYRAGVKRIFALGGAQAVAAMAYGTSSVPKVHKIFGPGNQFVTTAKRLVSNDPKGAAIDMPAGPSEVLVIADKEANPAYVAADLLSQAEHGPDSQVILISDDITLVKAVLKEVEIQLAALARREIAVKALSSSTAIIADSLKIGCQISNRYAPEHLILQVREPEALLSQLRNAGSIFLGAYTPESLGDYASGTNHTLPTYGYAMTYSALGTDDYRRRYTVQQASREGLQGIAEVVMTLAEAEGLGAHRNAVAVRLD